MAVSSEFGSKIGRRKTLLKNIEQLKLMPGISGLLGGPLYYAGLGLGLGPVAGALAAYKTDAKLQEIRRIFTPSKIDPSYQSDVLEDATVLDRMNLGMAMRLDDYKSGRELFSETTGLQGADCLKAYQAARANDFVPAYIPDAYLTRHMTFMGQTGVGKTEAQLAMLQQSIARGGGGIMIEMKGDGSLPARAYELAKAYGAEKRFRLITLDDISISQKYNPIFSVDAKSAINTIMSLLSSDIEQFHKDVASWALNTAITVISGQKSKPKYTLQDLFYLVGDIDLFYSLCLKMTARTTEERDAKIFATDFFRQFQVGYDNDGEIMWNTSSFTQRMMGVKAALQPFAKGDFAEILCTVNPDLNLREAIENGEIVVLSASTLKDRDGVATFARLFMADLAVAVGEIQGAGTKPLIPFPVWLDEYASFKHSYQESLFQLARSANVGLIIGVQGFNFLANGRDGDTFAKNVLANCWNHIFFDIKDTDTRELAAKLSGTIIMEMEQVSESESTGEGYDKAKGDIVGTKNKGKSISTGIKQTREDQIQSEDLMLDAGDAIWIGKFETYRTRLPFVDFKKPPLNLKEEFKHFEKFRNQSGNGLGIMEVMAARLAA